MSKMVWLILAVTSLLITQTSAQTTNDLVGFFVSEGLSVYSQVTSAIASVQSEASEAAASSSSYAGVSGSSTASDGSSNPATTTSVSSSETSITSSPNDLTSTFRLASGQSATGVSATGGSTSSNAAAAAAASQSSGTESASQNGDSGNNNLPIILGSVLGALALGLLILVFLLCCKRRRNRSRRSHSMSNRGLSPESVEVESWRHPSGAYDTRYGSNKEVLGAAPLMSEHPAFKNHENHDNPFVPVPPPPRKSAPNVRVGLTDGTIPGDDPYLPEKGTSQPLGKKSFDSSSSHRGRNLAIGAGAAAIGAAAMHRHHKNKDKGTEVNNPYAEPIAMDRTIARKPVPHNTATTQAPRTSPSTTANDDAFALGKSGGRRSGESSRSRASRGAARANAAFNDIYAPLPTYGNEPQSQNHNHSHHGVSTATALGAGAIGGAALAHHHNRSRSSSTHSRSPHRHPHALANRKTDAQNNSGTSTSSNSKEYADALPNPAPVDRARSPEDVPAPAIPHRNNIPGRTPPAAALLTYVYSEHEHAQERARNRSRSSSRPRSYPIPPSSNAVGDPLPLNTPPRNPARASFPQPHDYAHMPLSSSVHCAMNTPPPGPFSPSGHHSSQAPSLLSESSMGGIVGDNGFPHHNVPRRKSGGQYDHGIPPPLLEISPPHIPPTTQPERTDSADSAWRLSMGMPGGWARPQQQGIHSRSRSRSNSPSTSMGVLGPRSVEVAHPSSARAYDDTPPPPGNRDSLISGSTAVSGHNTNTPYANIGRAAEAGKRLRLSDLRRQEEELLRRRGRESMGSEWGGDGGYDGYDGWGRGGGAGGYDVGYREGYGYDGRGGGDGSGRFYQGVGVAR